MCWVWENSERLSGLGTILAFFVAAFALWAQRKHNRLSVRPLAAVTCNDLEGKIAVTLNNNGTGPLIIDTFRIFRRGEVVGDSLYTQLPDWMTFRWYVGNVDGRSIAVGKSIELLIYDDPSETFQEQVRSTLSGLEIRVTYRDIYKKMQPPYTRPLKWFGEKRPRKG